MSLMMHIQIAKNNLRMEKQENTKEIEKSWKGVKMQQLSTVGLTEFWEECGTVEFWGRSVELLVWQSSGRSEWSHTAV